MFSQQSPFPLIVGNPSAALDELRISLSSAPLLHQLLSLLYSSAVVEALSLLDLSEWQETVLETLYRWPAGGTFHGGHMEDTIWIWILFFTLSQTLCTSTLTIFLPEYIGILVKYCGIRWMENANKSDIIKCWMNRSILVPVQMKKPPGLLKFPCVSWGCGSQRMV